LIIFFWFTNVFFVSFTRHRSRCDTFTRKSVYYVRVCVLYIIHATHSCWTKVSIYILNTPMVWCDTLMCIIWCAHVHIKNPASYEPVAAQYRCTHTWWQKYTRCLQLQVSFRKRATNYRVLWREMTYKDKVSYASSLRCTRPHTGCLPLSRCLFVGW